MTTSNRGQRHVISLEGINKISVDFFRGERKKYYKHQKKAEKRPDKYMSIIIDGMDQAKTHLPHWIQASKVCPIPSSLSPSPFASLPLSLPLPALFFDHFLLRIPLSIYGGYLSHMKITWRRHFTIFSLKLEGEYEHFMKTHLTGVLNHGLNLATCFLDFLRWPQDSNPTINCIITHLQYLKAKVRVYY